MNLIVVGVAIFVIVLIYMMWGGMKPKAVEKIPGYRFVGYYAYDGSNFGGGNLIKMDELLPTAEGNRMRYMLLGSYQEAQGYPGYRSLMWYPAERVMTAPIKVEKDVLTGGGRAEKELGLEGIRVGLGRDFLAAYERVTPFVELEPEASITDNGGDAASPESDVI